MQLLPTCYHLECTRVRTAKNGCLGGKRSLPFSTAWCAELFIKCINSKVSHLSKRFCVKIGLTSGRLHQVSPSGAPSSPKCVRSSSQHHKNSDKAGSADSTRLNWLLSWLTPSRRSRRNKVTPAMSSEEQQELDALEIEFISAQQSPNRKSLLCMVDKLSVPLW